MYKSSSAFACSLNHNVLIKLLIMFKVTLLLLVLNISQAGAEVFAQKASINAKNMPLKNVFQELRKQTGYHFIYLQEDLQIANSVSVNARNTSLENILKICFEDQPLTYEIRKNRVLVERKSPRSFSEVKQAGVVTGIEGIFPDNARDVQVTAGVKSIVLLNTKAQDRPIRGRVVDEKGEGMIGVTVGIKGTPTIAKTDNDGNFQITAPTTGGTLVFTAIGYETREIAIGTSSTVNATMKESLTAMDEVVVVGYGTQRKESLTGAISSIRSADITTTKTESLISNIQGKVPGVQIRQNSGEPGAYSNNVSIRGFGAPLVIIDGVPRDGTQDLAQLNSDDVESISFLKDGSAAIYGMNSGNGVILVTTKKGVSGKPVFNYSTVLTSKSPTGLEQTVDAYTYRVMKNEMDRNIGASPTYSDDIIEKFRTNQPGFTDNNWIDLTLHNRVFQQQHNLSLRGGTDKSRYFTSFGYAEDDGILKSNVQKYRRYNFRATNSSDLTDHLSLNINFAGRLDDTRSPRDNFLWVLKPIMVTDRGVNYHTLADPTHLTTPNQENTNAFAMMNPDIDGYRRQIDRQYTTTIDLNYKAPFLQGLSATILGAYDVNTRNESTLRKSYDLYDYNTDARVLTFGNNQYNNFIESYNRMYVRGQVNFQRKFAEAHNFQATGVVELTRTRVDNVNATRQFTDLFTSDLINQGTPTTATNSGFRNFGALAGYVGKLNYDYKGRYFLEAMMRYDGSFRYAPSKRWAIFPGIQGKWRISEEAFVKNKLSFLDDLSIRASYGEAGNDAGNAFAYIPGYGINGGSGSGYVFNPGVVTVGSAPPGVVNDALSWVTVKNTNIGLDFAMFSGKFSGSVDVFERLTTGALAARIQNPAIPNTFGASLPQENINSQMNRGIEVAIAHNGKVGQFEYTVAANSTLARSKTIHDERNPFTSSWDRWRNGNENRYSGRRLVYEYNGQYTDLKQYETAPLGGGTNGNSRMLPGSYALIDANGDGRINGDDQVFSSWNFGNINPPLQYGLALSGKWKSLDFNMLFQGASLYTINFANNDIWGYGRTPSLHQRYMDRWHPEVATANPYDPATKWVSGFYPALRSNFTGTTDDGVTFRNDIWTVPATFLRLKNVELGFQLPKALLSKIRLNSARIYLNGFNLLTFSRKQLRDIDPEKQEGDFDAGLTYPLMKSYNMGININF